MSENLKTEYRLQGRETERVLAPKPASTISNEPLLIRFKSAHAVPFVFVVVWCALVMLFLWKTPLEKTWERVLLCLFLIAGVAVAIHTRATWQAARRVTASVKQAVFRLDAQGISFPKILLSDFSYATSVAEPTISLGWEQITEWIVEKSWSDGPSEFRILLRDGSACVMNRGPMWKDQVRILEYVRRVGQKPVRLKESVA